MSGYLAGASTVLCFRRIDGTQWIELRCLDQPNLVDDLPLGR